MDNESILKSRNASTLKCKKIPGIPDDLYLLEIDERRYMNSRVFITCLTRDDLRSIADKLLEIANA